MGSDASLAELYRVSYGTILARCRRIIGDSAVAEEAAQEAFLRVLQYNETASEPTLAVALLSRIATNLSLNELRNRGRRAVPEANIDLFCNGDDEQAERRLLARHLLSRAPDRLRSTAWLYHVGGLEQQEIASKLGISRRTVVKRLAYFSKWARARLGVSY
jgi:RNA polymerase sigma-70 factor, ECF subfamily